MIFAIFRGSLTWIFGMTQVWARPDEARARAKADFTLLL